MLKMSNIFHKLFLSAVFVGLTVSAGKATDNTVGKGTADTTEKATDNTKGIDCPDLNALYKTGGLFQALNTSESVKNTTAKRVIRLQSIRWFIDSNDIQFLGAAAATGLPPQDKHYIKGKAYEFDLLKREVTGEITRCYYKGNPWIFPGRGGEFRLTHIPK